MKSAHMHVALTTAQMAEMLGMTEQQMIRNSYDLDLIDGARFLLQENVDLDNRDAIVAMINPEAAEHYPPGFVDAVVNVARASTRTLIG